MQSTQVIKHLSLFFHFSLKGVALKIALQIAALSLAVGLLTACGGDDDDDDVPPGPTVSVGNATVAEGAEGITTDVVFTLSLAAAASTSTRVNYATANGSATAGEDFTAVSGTASFPAGSTSVEITVTVLGDAIFEADETFRVVLSNPVGLSLGSDGTGTISDDDNADAKGYFFGSAAVKQSDDSTDLAINDLVGLAYNGRLKLFSKTGTPNVLYDITLDTVTVTDYTGTATVYVDGVRLVGTVAVTGTSNEARLTGTLAGEGVSNGSFDVWFDTASNSSGASIARIDTSGALRNWAGDFYGFDVDTGSFGSDDKGSYAGGDDTDERCVHSGTVGIPDSQLNIYLLNHDIKPQFGIGTCAPTNFESTGHTGFAAVINGTSVDDTVVYAFANGELALFARVSRLP